MIKLRYEAEFVSITENDQRWYGGDQGWFLDPAGKNGGCGVVAAANITAYLARYHPGLSRLYGQPGMEKKHFQIHMEQLRQYVRPWEIPFGKETLGVWPAFRLYKGVERYAGEQGIPLRKQLIRGCAKWSRIRDFVAESLRKDYPVAMLISRSPRYPEEIVERPDGVRWVQTHFAYHWVVITAMEERKERVFVKVSTWGGWSWLDLEEWSQAGGIIPVLIRFSDPCSY